ncbi:hypothetical protein PV325_001903 [Microctonus aethiopoides]|nr:hypothetical protein PV325_001903 [Microctonus aethiopoides]KAK0098529.1 hypothetical protein PV326_007207 [Microctonus aethiopoides]
MDKTKGKLWMDLTVVRMKIRETNTDDERKKFKVIPQFWQPPSGVREDFFCLHIQLGPSFSNAWTKFGAWK